MKEIVFGVDVREHVRPLKAPRKWLVWVALLVTTSVCVLQIIQWNGLFVMYCVMFICNLIGFLRNEVPDQSHKGSIYGDQVLAFGARNLVCKQGDTIVWHIPYERVSHIKEFTSGPRWAQSVTTLVYTNDNDSYMISGKPHDCTLEVIQQEIDRVKSHS